MNLRLARKNREVKPESWDVLYRNLIVRSIREKVAPTVNEENAVLRKTIAKVIETMVDKTELTDEQALEIFSEFYNYNDKIERCKAETREELGNENHDI